VPVAVSGRERAGASVSEAPEIHSSALNPVSSKRADEVAKPLLANWVETAPGVFKTLRRPSSIAQRATPPRKIILADGPYWRVKVGDTEEVWRRCPVV